MQGYQLTNGQARRFLLRRQGLLGEYQYKGKQGALAYIQTARAVQVDPVDVCGRSPDVALHSRVQGYSKSMLDTLLYRDRLLFEYDDKCLCVLPVEVWPLLRARREYFAAQAQVKEHIALAGDTVRNAIRQKGFVCAQDLTGLKGRMVARTTWASATSPLANAVLDDMYSTGEIVVHHRAGGRKYYGLAADLLPPQAMGAHFNCRDEAALADEWVKRRIAACGLLWNRGGDAWLNVHGFKTAQRNAAFARLLQAGEILPLEVEGIAQPLYCLAADEALVQQVLAGEKWRARCELIAPLDTLIWDRRLVEALFGFAYKWEIYTPVVQRKYGHYVWPVLWGERFAGRIEVVRQGTGLHVKNFWPEKGVRPSKRLDTALGHCLSRFARFNGAEDVTGYEGAFCAK